MDIVYLKDLRIKAVIGAYAWERQLKQTVVLDLEMGTDIRAAGHSDTIEDTLNYKEVAKRVMEFTENSRFHLVEALAEGIAELVLREFPVPWLRVRVNKQGAVRGVRDVGVIIERSRES
ncbi:MAG: dihydroneopterin aldolase [Gammaproteobacteria bacterium]